MAAGYLGPELILREVPIPPGRKVALWKRGPRLAGLPADTKLKPPSELAEGVSQDADGERVWSRFNHHSLLPIDIVARRLAARPLLAATLALALLAGCALRPAEKPAPEAAPPAASDTPPPEPPAPVQPVEPVVRLAEPAQSTDTERELREQLQRDPESSIASAEAGYFLDVLQARLLQMQTAGVQVAREDGQFRITLSAPMFESGQVGLTDEARARLLAVGHGATLPRADNATPEGQAANRRVELVLRPVVRG